MQRDTATEQARITHRLRLTEKIILGTLVFMAICIAALGCLLNDLIR